MSEYQVKFSDHTGRVRFIGFDFLPDAIDQVFKLQDAGFPAELGCTKKNKLFTKVSVDSADKV